MGGTIALGCTVHGQDLGRETDTDGTDSAPDSDTDSDSDADADSDADTDADSDMDADSDGDTGGDADSDGDADGDGDSDSDGNNDIDADSDSDADTGGDADADSDTDSDADSDTDTPGDTDVDSDTDIDTDADADTGTGTDADADADIDSDADGDFEAHSGAMGDNPIVQTLYTADPAPMVYDGRLYVYTTHDEDELVDDFFTMYDWRVHSTTDLVNWTDHGSPMAYTDFSWAEGDAWAAQCIHRNGKFYLYAPLKGGGGKGIGVGVSDTPEGPFTDAIGSPLVSPGWDSIDPTVFIDDDGQAYLYWGNPELKYVLLNDDMISYSGGIQTVPNTTASFGTRTGDPERPTTYEEGPWFYKRNDLYYMVFAGGPLSEHIGYATSPGPTGPWTYGGVVMPTAGSSFTNHPGVVDYKGASYLFYHNGALPGGGGYHRSVCAAKFEYNADGTIPEIPMDSARRPGVGSLNPYVRQEAETMAWGEGVETERCDEGGMNVANIHNGDTIKVLGVNFVNGVSGFEARVASETSGGDIEIHLDDATGTLVGTCAVPGTGGWQSWETVSCDVDDVTGIRNLYLVFKGGGDFLFNVNWWRFIAANPGASDANEDEVR